MGKGPNNERQGPPIRRSGPSLGWIELLTLAGLGLVAVITYANYNATVKLQTALNDRMGQVDTRLTQIQTKVEMAARPAQQQRGPDPNKIYTVKVDGAPYEGPKDAPVVIAEFSDFQ